MEFKEPTEEEKLVASEHLSTSMDAYVDNQTIFIKKIDKSLDNQRKVLNILSFLVFIGLCMGIYLVVLGNGFSRLNQERASFAKEKEVFVRLKVVQDSSNAAREQSNVKMMADIFKQDSIAKLKNVIKADVVNTNTVNTVNAQSINVDKKKK